MKATSLVGPPEVIAENVAHCGFSSLLLLYRTPSPIGLFLGGVQVSHVFAVDGMEVVGADDVMADHPAGC